MRASTVGSRFLDRCGDSLGVETHDLIIAVPGSYSWRVWFAQYSKNTATATGGHLVLCRTVVVMHLLFLLPLVSPRARARFPIAVTDDIVWCHVWCIGGHS